MGTLDMENHLPPLPWRWVLRSTWPVFTNGLLACINLGQQGYLYVITINTKTTKDITYLRMAELFKPLQGVLNGFLVAHHFLNRCVFRACSCFFIPLVTLLLWDVSVKISWEYLVSLAEQVQRRGWGWGYCRCWIAGIKGFRLGVNWQPTNDGEKSYLWFGG